MKNSENSDTSLMRSASTPIAVLATVFVVLFRNIPIRSTENEPCRFTHSEYSCCGRTANRLTAIKPLIISIEVLLIFADPFS